MDGQTLLLWAGNTNLQMLNSWETSAWEISYSEIWDPGIPGVLLCFTSNSLCKRVLLREAEMNKLDF